jgi:hypothetical protein
VIDAVANLDIDLTDHAATFAALGGRHATLKSASILSGA